MSPLVRTTVVVAVLAAAGVACNDITRPIPSAASRSFLASPAGHVVVSPGDMHGWSFSDERTGTACTTDSVCTLVNGPAGVPAGTGSAELATSTAVDGTALVLVDYQGVRLDHVTDLRYSTYRQSTDPGHNLAIALQFNADYDLDDASVGYQGRLVLEPYQGQGGNVPDTTWQQWDARAGKWWGTRATVSRGGVSTTNPCVQATPCTWTQLLAAFPNVGVHATYGAVYLKAGSSWPGFRGNVDNLTIGVDGAVTTFDFERTTATVPAHPITALPDWIYADTNFVSGGSTIAGDLAKNVVVVAFDPGTSSDARTAAVARVNGSVVGGIALEDEDDGVYYVRPADGSTPTAVLAAVHALATAPGVAMAIPIVHDTIVGNYRRPFDGTDAQSWKIDKLGADGMNWALESIAAPLAWGCTTGDPTTRVAVVDGPYHQVRDVEPDSIDLYRPHYAGPRNLEREHGNAVASILAATGNNNDGSTGVMWRSDLRLFDMYARVHDMTGLPAAAVEQLTKDGTLLLVIRLRSVVRDGARVINLSQGITMPDGADVPADATGETYLQDRILPALRWVLRLRDGQPNAPLFVVAAGNGASPGPGLPAQGRDARWNGFPLMEDEFPGRMLAVAATHADGVRTQLRDDSNFGRLVQVAAPGDRVMAIDQDNNTFGFEGTSAATPLVSGVAGLLFSFDPSLTAAEVSSMIVEGATNGGLTSARRNSGQNIPYLNAYEALKVAAARPGAPLCGNRVWKDGDVVYAERSAGPLPLVTLPHQDWQSSFISVYHGGRRFDMDWSRQFNWEGGNPPFVEQSSYEQRNYSENGGTFLSYDGANHDNTWFYKAVVSSSDETGFMIEASMRPLAGQGTTVLRYSPRFPRSVPTSVCVRRDVQTLECKAEEPRGDWDDLERMDVSPAPRLIAAADAADSTKMYVVVNMMHFHAPMPTGWSTCEDDPGQACATGGGTAVQSSGSTAVYHVSFEGGTWTPIPLAPAPAAPVQAERTIEWLGIGETGKEMVYGIGRIGQQYFSPSCTNQSTDFVSLELANAGHVYRHVALPDGAVCSGEYEAGGSIAPSRNPLAGPGLIAGTPSGATRPAHRTTGRGPLKR